MFNKLLLLGRRLSRYVFISIIGFGFLALFSYIYNIVSSRPDALVSLARGSGVKIPLPVATMVKPTPTAEITDYRTILLLERATNLILSYVDKVKGGEIDPGDASIRGTYLNAFPVAIDAYNHTSPTPGMEHAWNNVTMVTEAYTLVYPILQRGNAISNNDLFNLRSSRQWLINYRDTEEAVLSSRGLGTQFFTGEQQAVEQLLQEALGSTPVPEVNP